MPSTLFKIPLRIEIFQFNSYFICNIFFSTNDCGKCEQDWKHLLWLVIFKEEEITCLQEDIFMLVIVSCSSYERNYICIWAFFSLLAKWVLKYSKAVKQWSILGWITRNEQTNPIENIMRGLCVCSDVQDASFHVIFHHRLWLIAYLSTINELSPVLPTVSKEQEATYVKNMGLEYKSLHFQLESASGASDKPQTQWVMQAAQRDSLSYLCLGEMMQGGWCLSGCLGWENSQTHSADFNSHHLTFIYLS